MENLFAAVRGTSVIRRSSGRLSATTASIPMVGAAMSGFGGSRPRTQENLCRLYPFVFYPRSADQRSAERFYVSFSTSDGDGSLLDFLSVYQ